MYRITKDGASLGMTEAPTYIKQAPNGCLVLCPENEAMGIAHEGQVYSLLGREPLTRPPSCWNRWTAAQKSRKQAKQEVLCS